MKLLKALFSRERPPDTPPGRNEPCWCGSGKKYKHCHFQKDLEYYAMERARRCGGFG